jgi:DNA-binding CsgD family transcriptional regulator
VNGIELFAVTPPASTLPVAFAIGGSDGSVRLLDAAGAAVVAHDERARQIHATPQVARVLGADPERAAVERAITRLARDLTYRSRAHGHSEHSVPPQTSTEVRTALGTYALVAFRVAPGFFGPHAAVMVSVAGGGPRMLGDADLRERFGLTGREVEVARLMASGLTNRAIAERIGTSPHTVRHQGERVFDKLRVRTRADIAAKLRSD